MHMISADAYYIPTDAENTK